MITIEKIDKECYELRVNTTINTCYCTDTELKEIAAKINEIFNPEKEKPKSNVSKSKNTARS